MLDRYAVFQGKRKVALIVRRHTHYSAVAVAHQHIVAHPNWHAFAGQWVRYAQASGHALLFHGGHVSLGHAASLAFSDEGLQFRVAFSRQCSQGVLGGDGAEGDAHDGVGACGEHIQFSVLNQFTRSIFDFMRESKTHAGGFANPVFLHHFDALWPLQAIQILEQHIGVIGNRHVIHGDISLFNHSARAPAFAVNDLFIGQHGLVNRVPVHGACFLVHNAFLKHLQKQPLVPLVVIGFAGGYFLGPVNRQTHRFHLFFHVVDVAVGPGCWRLAVGHRCVFSWHAERIPPHGHQGVVALHALLANHHIVDGVVAHMAHVQLAAWVWQHGNAVVLGL